MRRRELLRALSVGGAGISAGCLARAREAITCGPSARFGVLIENHRERPQSVRVEIETGVLRRAVFSKTFDVPAATDPPGMTYHPELVYEPEILDNLRSYTASVFHDGETAEYSWRVHCRHLSIRIHEEGHASPAFSTISPDMWERMAAGH